eukprot:6864384-Prymnesium_polylepis.1
MLLTPLGLREFNERVVSPLRNRSVSSYDGTDQGALNTMLYKHLVWGSRYAILHPRFNVVARGLKSSESRTMKSAVVHFTGTAVSGTGAAVDTSSHTGVSCPRYPDDIDEAHCMGACVVRWYTVYEEYDGGAVSHSSDVASVPMGFGRDADLRRPGDWRGARA